MPLTLKANSLTYCLEDESGYSFTINAVHDPEWGWEASVTMTACGMKTSEGAIEHLGSAAEAFLRQLNETYGPAK